MYSNFYIIINWSNVYMDKIKITEQIYHEMFDGEYYKVRFNDLPSNIKPDDIININREPSYHSENNSYDAFTELIIEREREENDEEYQRRIEKGKEWKQKRYEHYLELKKEFENYEPNTN